MHSGAPGRSQQETQEEQPDVLFNLLAAPTLRNFQVSKSSIAPFLTKEHTASTTEAPRFLSPRVWVHQIRPFAHQLRGAHCSKVQGVSGEEITTSVVWGYQQSLGPLSQQL